jgi:hypothetical protein
MLDGYVIIFAGTEQKVGVRVTLADARNIFNK